MKKWLREPLLHFLVIGAAIFGLYRWSAGGKRSGESNDANVLRISSAEVEWIKQTWAQQASRPPDQDELRGLFADYLKEKLLEREARAMHLDENDTDVRQLLARRMIYMAEDAALAKEPSDQQLRAFYDAHAKEYEIAATATMPAHAPALADIRAKLQAEWFRLQQKAATEQLYARLFKKYEIVVDDAVRPLLPAQARGGEAAP